MRDVFIVSAVRTPVGKQRGYYREYIAPELLALVLNEVVERVNLDVTLVDDVITGCVYQIGEQGFNLARMGVLSSRLPVTLGGISVNRQCGSSLKIISLTSPSKPVQFYGEVKESSPALGNIFFVTLV